MAKTPTLAPPPPTKSKPRTVVVGPGDQVRKPNPQEILANIPRQNAQPVPTQDREQMIRDYCILIASWQANDKVWNRTIGSSVAIMALTGANLLGRQLLGMPDEEGNKVNIWETCKCADLAPIFPASASLQEKLRATYDAIEQWRSNPSIWPTFDNLVRYALRGAQTLAAEMLGESDGYGKPIKLWQTYRVDPNRGRTY